MISFESTAIAWAGTPIIYYYGIILVTGVMMAGYLAAIEAQRRHIDPNIIWDGLLWALIFGVIGARLWHVFTPMSDSTLTTAYYFQHPLELINVRNGGLGIPGAVLGGVFGLWLFSLGITLTSKQERQPSDAHPKGRGWFKLMPINVPFAQVLDIASPALLLGQSIGRWGNYVNQELIGKPTDLAWGMYIDPARRVLEYADFTHFHPVFLYESILTLLGMIALLYISHNYRHWLKTGDVFLIYLIYYPLVRFFMEFVRVGSNKIGNLNTNQVIMLVVAIIAAASLAYRHRRQRASLPSGS